MKVDHRIFCRLLQTGQTTKYHDDDDGDLEKGIPHDYGVLTAGQYSGTTNIVINGKTHALSNNCVWDNRTGLMWARYVPAADIGPAANGLLFWEQYTITGETVTFATADDSITADAGTPFDTGALCAGRKFTVSGTVNNDGTYTVSVIANNKITCVENLADEASIATDFATVDDLIWDVVDQANANSLGGWTDWRVPNPLELLSLVDFGADDPCIDTVTFPSTPSATICTSTTHAGGTWNAWGIYFWRGDVGKQVKANFKYYCRLVRGN